MVRCQAVGTDSAMAAAPRLIALDWGSSSLRAFLLGDAAVVLPRATRLLPVGGITPEGMAAYRTAGASGFGLGSALYSPGMPVVEVAQRAQRFVAAWRSS